MKISNRVFLTVDVEGDWSLFPNEQKHFDGDLIIQNLDILDGLITLSKQRLNIDIPVTWFIRCDESVKVNLGSYEGLLEKLGNFIQKKTIAGDSFGLHPHLYSFSQKNSHNNELTKAEIENQIGEAMLAWKNFFGEIPKFTRIGEARMCNIISSSLDKYGIEIDSTALPGRARHDNGFNFDWSLTGSDSYTPSRDNYQVPSKSSFENLGFIEAPFTMVPTQSSMDKSIISRYLNLSFKNHIIDDSLDAIHQGQDVICVVHPHEVISKNNHSHHIISYSGETFFKNIQSLNTKLSNVNFFNFESLNS